MSRSSEPGPAPGAKTAELADILGEGLSLMQHAIAAAVDADARARLIELVLLLERWGRIYNLTAVRDPREMVPRHLLDSLVVLPYVVHGPVLDVGTGAGLPGLPLAIARPELDFTLLDSNGKKIRFVRQAVLTLGLHNVDVVQCRVETYRPAQKFATIVSRALASLSALRDGCAHLAAPEGRLLALKGRLSEQEIAPLMRPERRPESPPVSTRSKPGGLGGAPMPAPAVYPLQVPFLDGERNLVELIMPAG